LASKPWRTPIRDYYFDHLKQTVASAPSGGTEFGKKVKACAEQNIASTQQFVRDLELRQGYPRYVSNSDGIYPNANGGVRGTSQKSWRGIYQSCVRSNEQAPSLKPDLERARLIDQVCIQEILPPEKT
jgi:hypothetical protein